ncbi:aldo/keto reductase [Pseudonocardia ailaonensis]|uniref:Aldo/keto reductase n=1 Tax=Pseudonocardia ailaonensis TaxID=367279 RepID=A0ABN2MZ89_9PSEU
MQTRVLGTELTVSAVGLGAMALSEQNYGPVDEAEAVRTLHEAIDGGVTLVDTAETYGHDHANELLLGRALGHRRDHVVLSTKFGLEFDARTKSIRVAGAPDTVKASCEASLRRLRTDHIDLYYQHRVNPAYPVEDVFGVLSELVAEGKVRYLGMSEPGIDSLRRAHAVHPITAVQNEYSLFTRDPETELLPVLRELGIGLVCFGPLGRGVLTGRFRTEEDFPAGDFRRLLPRFQGENLRRNVALVDRLGELASGLGCTSVQLALAWLLTRGPDVVPIPGMETRERLRHNLHAADLELGAATLAAIEEVIPTGALGSRYGARFDELSNAESAG